VPGTELRSCRVATAEFRSSNASQCNILNVEPTAPIISPLEIPRGFVNWIARSPGRPFLIIFVLALGVRGFFLTKVPESYVLPHDRWEMEAVAMALAERGEFADPYALPTGPTAHLPPIVPGILALVWRLFDMGRAAGYAAWILRIAGYSAMYAMIPWFAAHLGIARQAGIIAGLAGALMAEWPGHGEALTAIAMGLLAIAFSNRWSSAGNSPGGSLLLGLAAGASFHLQPALLPVVIGFMVFELWWSRDSRKWTLSALIASGIVLACLPWGVRNYVRFDALFFVRSNLGLELRLAFHEGAAASMETMDAREEHRHPRTHEVEAKLVREFGEVAYMRAAGRDAWGWMRANPAESLQLIASRIAHFWFGPLHRPGTAAAVTALTLLAFLGAWRTLPMLTVPQRAALLIPIATYPLVYYFVTYMWRYRTPLNWLILLLACAAIWSRPDRVKDMGASI